MANHQPSEKNDNSWIWMLSITGIVTLLFIGLTINAGLRHSGSAVSLQNSDEKDKSIPPNTAYASVLPFMPAPGELVNASNWTDVPVLRGIKLYADNPFQFDFIIEEGDSELSYEQFEEESAQLIRYFLAALTIPEEELWVNLSPDGNDRVIPDKLALTDMGRDMLAEDYVLKQLAASLTYPENKLGSEYWNKIFSRIQQCVGSTNMPIDSCNRLWIIPSSATIYEDKDKAFITDSYMKVMLEEDYLAMKEGAVDTAQEDAEAKKLASLTMKEVILPKIEQDVNYGENFTRLRQIYHALLLATWFKQQLKEHVVTQLYADQEKIKGVDVDDPDIKDKIYQQYLDAFKTGVYNYLKKEYNPYTGENIKRHYYSGGLGFAGKLNEVTAQGRRPLSESMSSPLRFTHALKTITAKLLLGTVLTSWAPGNKFVRAQQYTPPAVNKIDTSKYSFSIPVVKEFPALKPRSPEEVLPELAGNAGIGGGLGTGSISRTLDGRMTNFTFSAAPVLETLPQGQTSVFVKVDGKTYATPLGIRPQGDTRLSNWNWDTAEKVAKSAQYTQSFPYAIWEYPSGKEMPAKVSLRLFSPFIPGDINSSTEPVIVNEVVAENPTDKEMEVSFMFSAPNIVGYQLKQDPQNSEAYSFVKQGKIQRNSVLRTPRNVGIILDADNEQDPRLKGQTALVTENQDGLTITYDSAFDVEKDTTVWKTFSTQGELPIRTQPNSGGKEQAGAIAVKFKLKAGENRTIPFSFAWDFPEDWRQSKTKFLRYHTARYGTEGDDAFKIAANALRHRTQWKVQINQWQRKILDNPRLPAELKEMLINELYFLVQGGSLLTPERQFYILESIVYRIYNTLDVWFYTPMLAVNFPELEKEFVKIHSKIVPLEDHTLMPYWNAFPSDKYGRGAPETEQAFRGKKPVDPAVRYWDEVKHRSGSVAHHVDFFMTGRKGLTDDPDWEGGDKIGKNWGWQNHNGWKDLSPKFVLMAWRAYYMDGQKDTEFVREVWPSVKLTMEWQKGFDTNNDGLPDHEGFPDQTYDTWGDMKGAGIMTADLTVHALEAAINFAEIAGDTEAVSEYRTWLAKARESIGKLWNGAYYNVNEGSTDIMADAFPGTLYAKLYGLQPVLPEEQVRAHLRKVYENNFKKFADGTVGIINAMTADGRSIGAVSGDIQKDEVWIGSQRAIIALMILYGMQDEAREILKTDHQNTWMGGFANMTPEAIDVTKQGYRAEMYMRAGAIYNILLAIEQMSNSKPISMNGKQYGTVSRNQDGTILIYTTEDNLKAQTSSLAEQLGIDAPNPEVVGRFIDGYETGHALLAYLRQQNDALAQEINAKIDRTTEERLCDIFGSAWMRGSIQGTWDLKEEIGLLADALGMDLENLLQASPDTLEGLLATLKIADVRVTLQEQAAQIRDTLIDSGGKEKPASSPTIGTDNKVGGIDLSQRADITIQGQGIEFSQNYVVTPAMIDNFSGFSFQLLNIADLTDEEQFLLR